MLQAHVYGNERCAEDQQQDSDFDDAGRVSGRSEDPRRVSEPGAQQINGHVVVSLSSAIMGPLNFNA